MKKYLYTLLGLSLLACQKIDSIDYIPFKAGFQAPQVVRVGEPITFQTEVTTTGAQNFLWLFGDKKKTTTDAQNPIFAYDTIGKYTATLYVEMNKKTGVKKDSAQKTIFVLPVTHNLASNLYQQETVGSVFGLDDVAMNFVRKSDGGFYVLSQRDLNDIVITKLKADLTLDAPNPFIVELFGNSPVYPKSIIETSDGGCLVVGYNEFGLGDSDAFALKMSSTGAVEWFNAETNSSNYERYTSVVELANGNFVVAGSIGKNATSAVPILHTIDNDGDFVNKIDIGQYKNCHINQIRYINNSFIIKKFVLVGKYADEPMMMTLDQNLQFNSFSKINLTGEAYSLEVLQGNKIFVAGRGYTKGNDNFQDSTSFAFGARFDAITGVTPTWVSRAKMYREHYVDAFVAGTDLDNVFYVGEHYNPVSSRDLFFTKTDAQGGDIKKVRLLGDESDHRPVRVLYDATDGYLYVLATTREFVTEKNSLYDVCIVKTKLTDILN
jgi:hypothetical protein